MADSCDVAIIGGGIIGTSAAAYLAEAGRSVILFEREELGAGASGRNSGVVQHPFDPPLAELHHASLPLYRELADADPDFELSASPAGLLLVAFDEDAVEAACRAIAVQSPELSAELLHASDAERLEPKLATGVVACRLATGYPVAPAAATLAFARRAARAGVHVRTGEAARPLVVKDHVTGVQVESGGQVTAHQVLVATGAWTPSVIPGWEADPPIRPIWGVVLSTSIDSAPAHVLEELGIDRPGRTPDELFSLVTTGTTSSVGSTFLAEQPDPQDWAPKLIRHASRFVPALANAELRGLRMCARPMSLDGRPIIGQVFGVDGLFVCAGHGPWGISTGPASALAISHQMLGTGTDRELQEFSPARIRNLHDGFTDSGR